MPADPVSNDTDMAPLEATSHPFLIRVWLEEAGDDAHPATWRGHITHVPSGRRQYLTDLESIAAFIAPYLQAMGVLTPGLSAESAVETLPSRR